MVRFRAHQGRGTLVVVAGFCVHTEISLAQQLQGDMVMMPVGAVSVSGAAISHALGAVALLLRVHVDVWLCVWCLNTFLFFFQPGSKGDIAPSCVWLLDVPSTIKHAIDLCTEWWIAIHYLCEAVCSPDAKGFVYWMKRNAENRGKEVALMEHGSLGRTESIKFVCAMQT